MPISYMTPFEVFFEGEFQRRLVTLPNEAGLLSSGLAIRDASWDRRAAFLLWVASGRPGDSVPNQDSAVDPFDDLLA